MDDPRVGGGFTVPVRVVGQQHPYCRHAADYEEEQADSGHYVYGGLGQQLEVVQAGQLRCGLDLRQMLGR